MGVWSNLSLLLEPLDEPLAFAGGGGGIVGFDLSGAAADSADGDDNDDDDGGGDDDNDDDGADFGVDGVDDDDDADLGVVRTVPDFLTGDDAASLAIQVASKVVGRSRVCGVRPHFLGCSDGEGKWERGRREGGGAEMRKGGDAEGRRRGGERVEKGARERREGRDGRRAKEKLAFDWIWGYRYHYTPHCTIPCTPSHTYFKHRILLDAVAGKSTDAREY